MTETVKFNVGGTIYEVSRSLLERYPDTMLAKSASERWQEDSMSEIFIERDRDLFRHVLSYLRDGRVVLPLTASREGLMLELQYYGLDGVEKGNIDDSLIRGTQCASVYIDMVQGLKRKIEAKEKESKILNEETKILQFSHDCVKTWFTDYISTDRGSFLCAVSGEVYLRFPDYLDHSILENFGLFLSGSYIDAKGMIFETKTGAFFIRERPSDKK